MDNWQRLILEIKSTVKDHEKFDLMHEQGGF